MEFEFIFPSTVFDVVKSGIDIDFSDLFNKKAIRRQLRIFFRLHFGSFRAGRNKNLQATLSFFPTTEFYHRSSVN